MVGALSVRMEVEGREGRMRGCFSDMRGGRGRVHTYGWGGMWRNSTCGILKQKGETVFTTM